ncbi:MAG: hypothetical protein AAF417_23065 [Pseudomonadota bacterium]
MQNENLKNSTLLPKEVSVDLQDGEGTAVWCDVVYRLYPRKVPEQLEIIQDVYGQKACFVPLSACSAGTGVFQVEKPDGHTAVGLRVESPHEPKVRQETSPDIKSVALDEIVIDPDNRQIYAGGGITLNQLNVALGETLGTEYRVLGADLTSYSYAQVGSTFMTGGMGPQRRYFSDSVNLLLIHDGNETRQVEGGDLRGYAGTYGWTGLVIAVRCQFNRVPEHEFAFAIPVSNAAEALARVVTHLAPYCYLGVDGEVVDSASGNGGLLFGIEHLTADSMQPVIDSEAAEDQKNQARRLQAKCNDANAECVLFVFGASDKPNDEFLLDLLDDPESESLTIGGIDLEHTEVFPNSEVMRVFRESVPYALRHQASQGALVYKNHTDVNVRLNPADPSKAMEVLWRINQEYVDSISQYIDRTTGITGSIFMYGHMSPYGVDPHNRLTLFSDDPDLFAEAKTVVDDLRADYYRNVSKACADTQSQYVGGEKSADSENKMLSAFSDAGSMPHELVAKINLQIKTIDQAGYAFSWRRFENYKSSW